MKVLYGGEFVEFASDCFGDYAAETGKLGNFFMEDGEMLYGEKSVIFSGHFIDFSNMKHFNGDICFSIENTKNPANAGSSGAKIMYSALEEIEI